MASIPSTRLGDFGAMVRVIRAVPVPAAESAQHKRRMIAELCRMLGEQIKPVAHPTVRLSPRHLQTLQGLLEGDSEKQIARRLGVSPHTVHDYVKIVYRRYRVSSRGELLARFVGRTAPRTPVLGSIP